MTDKDFLRRQFIVDRDRELAQLKIMRDELALQTPVDVQRVNIVDAMIDRVIAARDEARIGFAHGDNRAARRAARFGKKKSDGLNCVQNLPTTLYVRGFKK